MGKAAARKSPGNTARPDAARKGTLRLLAGLREGLSLADQPAALANLAPADRAREALLMGLRLSEGIDPARVAARSGQPFEQAVDLCGVDYLSYGQAEWDTTDVSSQGFSRGVEGYGPGRFR